MKYQGLHGVARALFDIRESNQLRMNHLTHVIAVAGGTLVSQRSHQREITKCVDTPPCNDLLNPMRMCGNPNGRHTPHAHARGTIEVRKHREDINLHLLDVPDDSHALAFAGHEGSLYRQKNCLKSA